MDELIKTEQETPRENISQKEDMIIPTRSEEPIDYPETPAVTPTHDYHVANKKYVDDSVPSVPVKATGAEINTGTNDLKFATPKAILDSDIMFELVGPSNNLKLSSDAEVSGDSPTYTLRKEITSTVSGKIKTKFDLRKYSDAYPATTIAGKIYVNGSAIGAEHTTNSATYETFEDNPIDVQIGDLVQVYVKSVDYNNLQYVRNFRLYWDVSTKDYVDAVDDANYDALLALINAGKNLSLIASDNLKASADTEGYSSVETYTKRKQITVRKCGVIRVKFDIHRTTNSSDFGRIYIDGVAVGTERNSGSLTYVTYTENITLSAAAFHEIQLYCKSSNGESYWRNFRLYWDVADLADFTVDTD